MSRSYRLRVRETLRRVIRASDHVSSRLELLEILPPEQMAELLANALAEQGFERKENRAVKKRNDITIAVELDSGNVIVTAESQQKVELASEKHRVVYDESRGRCSQAEAQLREEARQSLEMDADKRRQELQKQVTGRLEGELADLRQELDRAVNRATAAALKVKASQMGQIKTLTEDPASGSLTIVVEV